MVLHNSNLLQCTMLGINIFEIHFAGTKTQAENANDIGRLDIALEKEGREVS